MQATAAMAPPEPARASGADFDGAGTWLRRRLHTTILLVVLATGAFLRLYRFPSVPAGLNQDELSAAYEAYSLSLLGTDRWGHKWPVYFPSWGSGQNVLQSYLSIPVIKLFGLTPLAVRLVPLVLALGTLPLLYLFVARQYDRTT